MSQEIRVGDLVYVAHVRQCGCDSDIGILFIVSSVYVAQYGNCPVCGFTKTGPYLAAAGASIGKPLSRLRRIPPLEQLDGCSEDVHKIVKEPAL